MRSPWFYILIALGLLVGFRIDENVKINGVNYVSPLSRTEVNGIKSLGRINANWIALCPFAFMKPGEPTIEYNTTKNWWGDTHEGIIKLATEAHAEQLSILLKPHFWVQDEGWPGQFDLPMAKWKTWEKNYTEYMIEMAMLADSLKIEMLSIGTEFKTAVIQHHLFWEKLIDTIRLVYHGKLLYSANWDEYDQVRFWNKLDFIGVDAYFPLTEEEIPTDSALAESWKRIIPGLERIARINDKKIIFTEYGYRSVHKAAWKQWEFEYDSLRTSVNLIAQEKAYEALYEAVWNKSWMAGGFIWKWFDYDSRAGGSADADYTPQHKPAEEIIQKWYSE